MNTYEKYFKERFHNDPEFRQKRYDSVNKYVRARKLVDEDFKQMFRDASKKNYEQKSDEEKKIYNEKAKARSQKCYRENEEYRKRKIEYAKRRYYENKAKKQLDALAEATPPSS